jgi:hypothetical protein
MNSARNLLDLGNLAEHTPEQAIGLCLVAWEKLGFHVSAIEKAHHNRLDLEGGAAGTQSPSHLYFDDSADAGEELIGPHSVILAEPCGRVWGSAGGYNRPNGSPRRN